MALTIALVLGVGVEAGIVAGVILSLLLFLWRTSRPHMAVLGQVPGTEHYRNVDRHEVVVSKSVLSVRVDESLYFANARSLEDHVNDAVARHPGLRHVVLQCSAINAIDASALESLEAIDHRLGEAGLVLHLSEVKGPVMDKLQTTSFLRQLRGQEGRTHYQAVAELTPETTTAPACDAVCQGRGRPCR